MNILIPHSWLKEYLEAKATPAKIAERLSLCGPSIEKVSKVDNDFVYDIEITTNRVDMMSVFGIAREAAAILPQFGIPARLKKDPYQYLEKEQRRQQKKDFNLKVIIKDKQLVPRFTAIVLDNVSIKQSPKIVQERLTKAGMRPINNIVDVTNYLMRELGQPYHAFDFAEIKKQTMILRLSRRGEKITTLDGQTHILPGNDIVIEDGSGRIIDLCGIMGASNSHISDKTKTVLLFVQTYSPSHIRQTCMNIGKRSEAAALFEKSPDPEMVLPALYKGINLIKKHAQGQVVGSVIDIYPKPYKPKKVKVSMQKIAEQLGVNLSEKDAIKILNSLGISASCQKASIVAKIPSWRAQDISIAEDLIEEIARLYGFHNLPSRLPTGDFPKKFQGPFDWEEKIKQTLKNWGFIEVYNYSFTSGELIEKAGFDTRKCLKLSNPLTSEWEYMRPSLIPGILKTIALNLSREEVIKIFELSKIYIPKKGNLPNEKSMLVGAITGESFYQLKGIVEALLGEIGIKKYSFSSTAVAKNELWHPGRTAGIIFMKGTKDISLGTVGEIHPSAAGKFEIHEGVTVFELDFEEILKQLPTGKTFTPISKYPAIVEDLAFVVPEKTLAGKMIEEIQKTTDLVSQINLLDSYQNTRTFRIFFQHPQKGLNDQEVKKIREEIIKKVSKKFKAKLKSL